MHESRDQQDNEQWHLLILEELVERSGRRENFVRYRLLPQALAFVYYQLSWLLYVLHPAWSYSLNADFEDHAEHEYALFVEEHPEFDDQSYDGQFAEEYGRFASLPTCSARSATTSGCTSTRAWPAWETPASADPRFR